MKASPIKYKYALNEKGVVVNINEIFEEDRKDYECLGCDDVLRPVLPKTNRRKHFRHKINISCSLETYLHRLSKLLFIETYSKCLKQGIPYNIEYELPVVCNFCTHGPCTTKIEKALYDLTRSFTSIEEEQIDNEFIPDVLLKTKSEEKIYIEVAVTHKSSTKKVDSGIRIIEFIIEKEKDLSIFNQTKVSFFHNKVRAINFNPDPINVNFKNNCHKKITYFTVKNNGECKFNTIPIFEFDKIQGDSNQYISKVPYRSNNFRQEAEKAFLKGVNVKNCFLCRYRILASTFSLSEELKVTFCEFYESTLDPKMALKCENYMPDKNVFRFIKS